MPDKRVRSLRLTSIIPRIVRGVWLRLQALVSTILGLFFTNSIRCRICTLDSLSPGKDTTFNMKFGSEESINCKPPILMRGPLPARIEEHIGIHVRPRPQLAVVPNVELVCLHRNRFIPVGRLLQDGLLLEESTFMKGFINHEIQWPFNPRDAVAAWRNKPTDKNIIPDRFGLACTCAFPYHNINFYHWMVQTLPRLWGLQEFSDRTGRRPDLVLTADPAPWLLESLAALGYGLNDIKTLRGNGAIIEELVVLPFMERNKFLSRSAYQWLMDAFEEWKMQLPDVPLPSSPLVYISRHGPRQRAVLNEDSLVNALEHLGFICLSAENYSLAEKMRLFENTRVLVGAHGAGLTNMMFCKNAGILEIFPERIVTADYFVLANCLGHQYTLLQYPLQEGGDMLVNVDEVVRKTEQLIEVAIKTNAM